jgi:protein-S-isoprenylcysteine O-methyltransferase Ste14
MGRLVRALTYATLFVGLVLVFVPARVLEWSGVTPSGDRGLAQVTGIVVGLLGAGLAMWCILTLSIVGRGTPAPFDPPRRLVVVGPYRRIRNPMYLGAGLALAGAALYYRSLALLAYLAVFLLATGLFVLGYEEPTLRRLFGADYEAYCQRVGRWWPRRSRAGGGSSSGGA